MADVIQSGIVARLHGLRKKEWNGQLGLVGEFMSDKGRYCFHLLRIRNAPVLIKPENLTVADSLFKELQTGKSGEIDDCHRLPISLSRSLNWYPGNYDTLNAFDLDIGLYHFSFNAFGHHFLLDVRRCANGSRFGRIIQCWVKTGETGFSAQEWCNNLSWWNEKKLLQFLEAMNELKSIVTSLTEDELLKCVPYGISARDWALDIIHRMDTEGLTIMPGKLEQETNYLASLDSEGLEHRAVIFLGISINSPIQLMDFPIEQWRSIVKISKEWFKEFNAASFIRAVEWYKIAGDWTWREFASAETSI